MNFQFPISNFQFRKQSRGFTIVETLVAIAVLMIAIAGPLVIANNGLVAAENAKDQMIASFLAQESMMVVKNGKDANFVAGGNGSWLSGATVNFFTCTSNSANLCDASAVDTPAIVTCNYISGLVTGCPLYLGSNGYSHNGISGAITKFYRHFNIPPSSSQSTCLSGSSGTECKLTVTVSWYEGSVPESVTLTSEITNSIR